MIELLAQLSGALNGDFSILIDSIVVLKGNNEMPCNMITSLLPLMVKLSLSGRLFRPW
jgi:hypothetical protein